MFGVCVSFEEEILRAGFCPPPPIGPLHTPQTIGASEQMYGDGMSLVKCEVSAMIQGPMDWTEEQNDEIKFASWTSLSPFEFEVLDAFCTLREANNLNEIEYQNELRVTIVRSVSSIDDDEDESDEVETRNLDGIDSKLFGKTMLQMGFPAFDAMLASGGVVTPY